MAETAKSKAKKATTTRKKAARKPKAEPEVIDNKAVAKSRFNKALDEAKAGAAALADEAKTRAGTARGTAVAKSGDLKGEAQAYAGEAKDRAIDLAKEGKSRASDAIGGLGEIVSENATRIDEALGPQYGDYARTASRTLQETAAKIEAKEVEELADDAREFVRKSPGLAVGIAAVAGFLVARALRGNRD